MMTFRRYYLAQSSKIIIIDNDLNFPKNGCTGILIFAKVNCSPRYKETKYSHTQLLDSQHGKSGDPNHCCWSCKLLWRFDIGVKTKSLKKMKKF